MVNSAYEGDVFIREFLDNPSAFFKGEEGFFILDRDWGVHRYYPSMVKMLGFIERGELSITDFEKGLESFVSHLNSGDIEYLSANAFYFNYVNVHGNLGIKDIFVYSSDIRKIAISYLRKNKEEIGSDHYCKEILSCYPHSGIGSILQTVIND